MVPFSMTNVSLPSVSTGENSTTRPLSDNNNNANINRDTDTLLGDKQSSSLLRIIVQILEINLLSELPLRIMFSFNTGQRLSSLKESYGIWGSDQQGRQLVQFLSSLDAITPSVDDTQPALLKRPLSGPPEENLNTDHCPSDRFMDAGNEKLFQALFKRKLPRNRRMSEGLPLNFVQKMLCEKVFRADYKDVDFTLALTALDYLRDFENTRRSSLRAAAERLEITKENWRTALGADADARTWIESIQREEQMIESNYAKLSVNLRVWTMVNELRQLPFYKPNVVAMLNTLFPPHISDVPNHKIQPQAMHKQRSSFYRYVVSVEKNGPRVLEGLITRLLKPGTGNSWPETRILLEIYTELADRMIKQANMVHGVQFFRPSLLSHSRTNSGTQRSSTDRPTTPSSANSSFGGHTITGTPKVSGCMPYDSSSVRARIYSRRKTNSVGRAQDYFGEHQPLSETPDLTAPLPDLSPNVRERNGSMSKYPKAMPITNSQGGMHRRNRTLSKPSSPQLPASPFIEQSSEAATSEIFLKTRASTPILDPREDPRVLKANKHKRTISSGRPTAFFENQRGPSQEYKSPWLDQFRSASPAISMMSRRTVLPNDNFEFLNRPYEESPTIQPALKKRPSLSNLFRKKSSNSLREPDAVDEGNPLGISLPSLTPPRTIRQIDPFSLPTMSVQNPHLPFLKKQKSYGNLEKKIPWPEFNNGKELRKQKSFGFLERTKTKETVENNSADVDEEGATLRSKSKTKTPVSEQTRFERTALKKQASFATPDDKTSNETIRSILKKQASFATLKNRTSTETIRSILKKQASFANIKNKTSTDTIRPILKKQASFATLKNKASTETIRPTLIRHETSFEPFPGAHADFRPTLKKKISFGFLQKMSSRADVIRPLSGEASEPSPLPKQAAFGIYENEKDTARSRSNTVLTGIQDPLSYLNSPYSVVSSPFIGVDGSTKDRLEKKSSMPTLGFLSGGRAKAREKSSPEPQYFETDDPHERIIIATPGRRIRKVRSAGSIRSNETFRTDVSHKTDRTVMPKLSLSTPKQFFRKFTTEKDLVTTSADIEEPFPLELQRRFVAEKAEKMPEKYTPMICEGEEEFKSKEYTRKWLLEESRARRFDLNKPKGRPVKTESEIKKMRKKQKKMLKEREKLKGKGGIVKKKNGRAVLVEEEEDEEWNPHATRKPLVRPFRTRIGSIFPLRFAPRPQKKLGYIPIDTSKYEKY